jgi:serine/threonine protein kinase
MEDHDMSEPDVTHPKPEIRAGDYVVGRKLGSGTFGDVFEARHVHTSFAVALKRLRWTKEDADRFRKEALYPSRVASESLHVLGVQSFFPDPHGEYFYLVTELIRHGDLRTFLEREPSPLPLGQALEIALGIARGLAAIHLLDIVHRDLKPRNVLMDQKDGRWIPKITDFGLARSSGSVSIGEYASPGYAAPEQVDLAEEKEPGPESDLFAFGMVLYELLTGQKVTTSTADLRAYGRWIKMRAVVPPPSQLRPELARSPELDTLVGGLLEHDRTRRQSSAAEVVRTLASVLRAVEHDDGAPPMPGEAAEEHRAQPRFPQGPVGDVLDEQPPAGQLQSTAAAATIKVLSPKAGDQWLEGTTQTIAWEVTGPLRRDVSTVVLVHGPNTSGGKIIQYISEADSHIAHGRFEWTVPILKTNDPLEATIRVSRYHRAGLDSQDGHSAIFAILPKRSRKAQIERFLVNLAVGREYMDSDSELIRAAVLPLLFFVATHAIAALIVAVSMDGAPEVTSAAPWMGLRVWGLPVGAIASRAWEWMVAIWPTIVGRRMGGEVLIPLVLSFLSLLWAYPLARFLGGLITLMCAAAIYFAPETTLAWIAITLVAFLLASAFTLLIRGSYAEENDWRNTG